MGCEDLYDIVVSEETFLSEFRNKTIGIDSTFWFERYYNKVVTDRFSQSIPRKYESHDISQLLSLMVSIPHLLRNDITPVFFFDPIERNTHPKADAKIPYLEYAPTTAEPEKQFPFLQRATELMLKYLNIDYCEAPLYAEADASKYAVEGTVDVVASNDYDTLLYGAPVTIRKKPYSSTWLSVELEETLKKNELTHRELRDAAILTGTDEVLGPYKGHIKEAISKIKQASNLDKFESEQNRGLRAPSLRISDEPPTFDWLHNLYRNPPLSFQLLEPSFPEPDFPQAGNFLYHALHLDKEVIDELLAPIRAEV